MPHASVRASDDDRSAVVALLRDAAGRGVLDLSELEERLAATYAARTQPELARLVVDLPPPPSPTTPPPRWPRIGIRALRNAAFRAHATAWGLTNGMLSGIWVVTGADGTFWPFFPAAGWGIGLGMHYVVADAVVARREGRAARTAVPSAQPAGLPAPPVRRFVVAAFVDVVGSTRLTEAMGDEGWAQVRRSLASLAEECSAVEGGVEANRAGDGLLLRFDEPAGAVRACIQILRRLERQRAQTGFAPSVRVGIHSGDAVDEGRDIIGAVVNLAARVSDAAEPDELLITEHVADHLAPGVRTESRGLQTLKGIERPRNLLAVDWR